MSMDLYLSIAAAVAAASLLAGVGWLVVRGDEDWEDLLLGLVGVLATSAFVGLAWPVTVVFGVLAGLVLGLRRLVDDRRYCAVLPADSPFLRPLGVSREADTYRGFASRQREIAETWRRLGHDDLAVDASRLAEQYADLARTEEAR